MPGGCPCVRELLEGASVIVRGDDCISWKSEALCPPREPTTGQELGKTVLHPVLRVSAGWERGRYREVVLARMEVWTPARLPLSWTKVTGAEVTKAEGERGRKEGAMENSLVVVAHP